MDSSNYPRDKTARYSDLEKLKRLNEDISSFAHVSLFQLVGFGAALAAGLLARELMEVLFFIVCAYGQPLIVLLGIVAARASDKWYGKRSLRPALVGLACFVPIVPQIVAARYVVMVNKIGQEYGVQPDLLNLNRKSLKAALEAERSQDGGFDWSKPPSLAGKNPLDD